MKKLHKVGKFYTRIIMNNIGIFIFIGILSVIFNDHGWFPDKDMYAISQLVYKVILPFIAYEGGRAVSGREGGIAGVLAVAGVIWSGSSAELFGAMLLGPAAGYLWKRETSWIEEKFPSSMQMLGKNLIIGITGGLFSAAGIYLILPLLEWILTWLFSGISFLARYNMTACLSIFIEPAKVFFLNNVVNHMLLVTDCPCTWRNPRGLFSAYSVKPLASASGDRWRTCRKYYISDFKRCSKGSRVSGKHFYHSDHG